MIPKKDIEAAITNPARSISKRKEKRELRTIPKVLKSDLSTASPFSSPSGVAMSPLRTFMKSIALKTMSMIAIAYGKTLGLTVKLNEGGTERAVSQKTKKPRRKSEPTNVSSLFPP